MGVHTYTMADITSTVAPGRLFQAIAIDNHNFAKNIPQCVKSIEFVQGDSTAVGCIKQINLPNGIFKYVKNRVYELDCDNLYTKYTTIEGDVLGDILECVVHENKFETSGEGGGNNYVEVVIRCLMEARNYKYNPNSESLGAFNLSIHNPSKVKFKELLEDTLRQLR